MKRLLDFIYGAGSGPGESIDRILWTLAALLWLTMCAAPLFGR